MCYNNVVTIATRERSDHMYFVDREKIETILGYIEQQLFLFEGTKQWETSLEKAALERICHTIIEGILDVGNAVIDGFIMRDPGSYEDIIDILDDEKVVSKDTIEGLKLIIQNRKQLVQEYTEVDHQAILNSFLEQKEALKQFAPSVRQYLIEELGPVTAFRN